MSGWFHTRGTWDDLFFPSVERVGCFAMGFFPNTVDVPSVAPRNNPQN